MLCLGYAGLRSRAQIKTGLLRSAVMQRQQREAIAHQQGRVLLAREPVPAKPKPKLVRCPNCEYYGDDSVCPHPDDRSTCRQFSPELGAYAG